MKNLFKLALIGTTLIQSNVFAGVVRDKAIVKTFKNTDCLANNTCDLTEFSVSSNDYHVLFQNGDVSHGSNAFMSYKTKEIDQLENYAIVQKIRGCKFWSSVNEDGSIKKEILESREFFGDFIKFKHPEWVIDSVDVDPVYNSVPDLRHGAHRWNTKADSFDKETEKFYFRERPTAPRLYVSDLPGTSFYEDSKAKNISLEFEACIYKTADIPLIAKPDDINFSTPIACHSWKSSFVFDHKKEKFEVKNEVDSFCLEKPEVVPQVIPPVPPVEG